MDCITLPELQLLIAKKYDHLQSVARQMRYLRADYDSIPRWRVYKRWKRLQRYVDREKEFDAELTMYYGMLKLEVALLTEK